MNYTQAHFDRLTVSDLRHDQINRYLANERLHHQRSVMTNMVKPHLEQTSDGMCDLFKDCYLKRSMPPRSHWRVSKQYSQQQPVGRAQIRGDRHCDVCLRQYTRLDRYWLMGLSHHTIKQG